MMKYLLFSVLIGAGATATMDVWGVLRKLLLGVAPPDYGLVGRWLAHVFRGRFRHDSIARAASVRGEHLLGWTAHYLTGIAFASILVVTFGLYAAGWVLHMLLVEMPAL